MTYNKFSELGNFLEDGPGLIHGRAGWLGMPPVNVMSQPAKSVGEKPYFKLIADPLRHPYEIGVMFPKEKDGVVFYSVILDSPLFPNPVHALLYPDRDVANGYKLIWNRNNQFNSPTIDARAGHAPGRRYIGADATP